MGTSKRTLEIVAQMKDEITRKLDKLTTQVTKSGKKIRKANESNAASFKKVTKAVKALVAGYLVFKAASTVAAIVQTTDQLGKLASASGDSVEAISALSFAFKDAGGNTQQFHAVLSSLLSSQRSAATGSKQQVLAFQQLGISIKELRGLSPANLMAALATGLERVETATERTQLLATIFPEQWRNVINLVDGGGDLFEKRLKDAAKAGAIVTRQQVQAAAEINAAWLRLSTSLDNLGRTILVELAPSLIGFFDQLSHVILNNKKEVIDFLTAIGSGIVFALDVVSDAVIQLVGFLERLGILDFEVPSPNKAEYDAAYDVLISMQAMMNDMKAAGPVTAIVQADLDAAIEVVRAAKQKLSNAELIGQKPIMSLSESLQLSKDNFINMMIGLKEGLAEAAAATPPVVVPADDMIKVEAFELVNWKDVNLGWEDGLSKLKAQAKDFDKELGKGLAATVVGTFDAFASGLASVIDGTKSAKQAWKDFAVATLKLIAQLIAKMVALKIAQSLLGGGNVALEDGGVLPGVNTDNAVPVQGYARGGIATSPQLAVFGEGSKNEAFVPLPDNRSIPVTFTGAQASQSNMVNVNVYAWDSKDAAQGLLENRQVLQQIFMSQADHQVGMRQTLQRAVR